jgi:Hint domain
MSGTRIRVARGDIAIDAINPGDDVVVVRDGQEALEPIKWVGYTHFDISRHSHPEEAAPIRFRKGAIAENQPVRDLARIMHGGWRA